MTNGDLTSRIVNTIKALNKDTHISRRYILSVAQSKAEYFIAQKLASRSIFREDSLFTTIECLELKELDTIKCSIREFKICDSLMISKNKLPKLIYSRYGNSIINVSTIDGSEEFFPTTPWAFSNYKKRRGSKDRKFYYVKDGYLYLLNTTIKVVNISLITLDENMAEELSSCKDCDNCKSVWDNTFICPDKLIEVVVSETLKEVSITLNIPSDENPNLDENIKSSTVQ